MPFCNLAFRAVKPVRDNCPSELQHLGDHLKRKRIELGLRQREVMTILKVSEGTVVAWEKHKTVPELRYIPRIIRFLGYLPFENILDRPFNEKVLILRQIRGISQDTLAAQIGVDPDTIRRWEKGHRRPYQRVIQLVDALLIAHTNGIHK